MKKAVDHDSLHWSACYKGYYRTHDNEKENAGYYPGQDRQICMITHNEEHPSDQEQDAQLPQAPEEFSDTELGEEGDSSSEETEAEPSYLELGKALQEAEKIIYYIKK
jgi:hypothetical protein